MVTAPDRFKLLNKSDAVFSDPAVGYSHRQTDCLELIMNSAEENPGGITQSLTPKCCGTGAKIQTEPSRKSSEHHLHGISVQSFSMDHNNEEDGDKGKQEERKLKKRGKIVLMISSTDTETGLF